MKNISLKNERGLTLVEILASITILSIVLLSFMTFFPQSIQLSTLTEQKLSAINLAERTLVELKEGTYQEELKEMNHQIYIPEVTYMDFDFESDLGLQRVHIKIYDNRNNELVTELFSYIETEE